MVAALSKRHDEDTAETRKARLLRRGPRRPVRLGLRTLREAAGFTQPQVATASGIAQGEVSKLETADTMDNRTIATLRRYLAALGDELEISAVSPLGHRFILIGKGEGIPEGARANEPLEDFGRILFHAQNLARSSGSPVAREVYFLIDLLASKLLGVEDGPLVKDEAVRRALPVLFGGQPGKDRGAVYRRIGHRVRRWAGYRPPVSHPPLAYVSGPTAAYMLAGDLRDIDPKFRTLKESVVESVLTRYRAATDKTRALVDAVRDLCVASKANGTSIVVDAQGSEGARERKRLRERVELALNA